MPLLSLYGAALRAEAVPLECRLLAGAPDADAVALA